jgi:enamine deaminase RidA (YjgF/YER057c/UK114 family)
MMGAVTDETVRPSRQSIIGSRTTYDSFHFAEAARVGDTVWVSGQRGFDENGAISDDPAEQARVTFRNLERILARAGAALADVVLLTSYHVSMADFGGFVAVKDEFIRPPYPAWTAVGVGALVEPAMKIEVAAVAVIGSGKGARVRD